MLANSDGEKLEALARVEFRHRQLTDAELALLHAAPTGQWAYYDPDRREWVRTDGTPPKADAPANLPEFSENGDMGRKLQPWGWDRNVSAGLIRWLCVSTLPKSFVDPIGLRLQGARIIETLNLEAVHVPFPLELQSCRLMKEINLNQCTISNLSIAGSWTKGITANGMVVSGSVNFGNGFHADGEIDLVNAKIDGNLDFSDATIVSSGDYAIVADNVKVTSVSLGAGWEDYAQGFRAEGTVWFPGATISGDFGGYGAEFTAPKTRKDRVALSLEGATVGGLLTLGNEYDNWTEEARRQEKFACPRFRIWGKVDLRGTRCQRYEDSNWIYGIPPSSILLDGFTYEIADPDWNAKTRLKWLENEDNRATQPYYQLAKYFDGVGKTADAKQVRIALERKLYPVDDNPLKLLKKPIGYGYRPENALMGVAIVCAVGWVVYWRSYRMGIMVPSDKDAANELQRTGKLPAHYPRFSPFIASLEHTFPLVKLGQSDKWQPEPSPAPLFEGNIWRRLVQFVGLRRSLRWFVWAQILLGWLLATLFLAAVTGLIQHGK
jgi:hypothetical protein